MFIDLFLFRVDLSTMKRRWSHIFLMTPVQSWSQLYPPGISEHTNFVATCSFVVPSSSIEKNVCNACNFILMCMPSNGLTSRYFFQNKTLVLQKSHHANSLHHYYYYTILLVNCSPSFTMKTSNYELCSVVWSSVVSFSNAFIIINKL